MRFNCQEEIEDVLVKFKKIGVIIDKSQVMNIKEENSKFIMDINGKIVIRKNEKF